MHNETMDILSPGRNIALKASAGSGKTFNLSLRVVNLLLEGVEPDRILCLTFTNKATNEMYERIVRTITYLAGGPSAEGSMLDTPNNEALTLAEYWQHRLGGGDISGTLLYLRERARELYEAVVREISRLRVSTIDGFFNSILRLFPFEAGVMPDFRIATESEEEGIYRRAYDEFTAALRSDASTRELLKRLVLLSGSRELSPFRLLDGYFRELLAMRAEIEELCEGRDGPGAADAGRLLKECGVLEKLEARVREAAVHLAGMMRRSYPELGKTAAAEVRRYEESSVKKLSALTSLAKDRYTDYRYFSSLEHSPEIQDAFDLLKRVMRDYFIHKNRLFQEITLHLFTRFLQYPDRAKRSLNALSFSDVTRICYDLLIRNSLIDESADYFYFRLDSRIEHLLIDEFQDTSIIQWRILKPMADELTSGLGQKERPGSFFYVGDPKQSIYRFRGGESGLFDAVLSMYPEKLKPQSLRRNFRSGRAIVDFVNMVFSAVSSAYGYDYDEQESTLDRQGFVDVRFVSSKKGRAERELCRKEKMQAVLSFVEALVRRGARPGDIAVLCQKNRTCEEYAGVLRENGYDVVTESAEALLEQPSVKAVMNLLRWLADQRQPVYLLGFLFSVDGLLDAEDLRRLFDKTPSWNDPAAALPRISERLSELQRLHGLVPVWRLIEKIITEFGLFRAFDYDPNLLCLAGTAASEEIADPLSIVDFIAFMEGRSSVKAHIPSGLSERSVRLMTVHKAKGLEFPYVILPELDIRMSFDARNRPLIIDHTGDLAVKGVYLSENRETASFVPEIEEVRAREEERIRTDLLNYLYVAMTRARDGLMIAAERPERPEVRQLSDVLYRAVESGTGEAADTYRSGAFPGVEGPSARREVPPPSRPNPFAGLTLPLKEAVLKGAPLPQEDAPVAEEPAGRETPDEFRDRLFGEAFHYAVEMMEDFAADSVPAAVARVRQRYASLPEDAAASIERRLSALVADEAFLRLLSGDALYREVPFARGGSPYRIDLLVFDGAAVRVLDFKTGRDSTLMEEYRQQVRAYMLTVGGCFSGKDIEGYLVFSGENSVDIQEVRLQ